MTRHVRECQECGHRQVATVPNTRLDGWRDLKCRKCKSPATSYGRSMEVSEAGVITEISWPEK